MKMHTTKISFLLFIILVLFLGGCSSVQKVTRTQKTYVDTKKADENIVTSYKLPIIKSTANTNQVQAKGGVTISVEIVPFKAIRNIEQSRNITYFDPAQRGYDIYEVSNTPYYSVSPENIRFKIKIRNRESVPLKLSEVGFALIIDGTQWSFPSGYLDDWNKGLILTGFEKEYIINGPQLDGLYSAQVVYLFLNGVPISYDEAGNIIKKDNFEWYFECKDEIIHKDEQKTYTYETSPVYKERCQKCSGTGVDPQAYKCSVCNGKGSYVNQYDKKTYKCAACSGSGIIRYQCNNCGGNGIMIYPKSPEPPIKNTITWTGWKVNVITNPPGAKVSMIDTKTGEYKDVGISNTKEYWFSSVEKSYPIIIKYQGNIIKVLPYDDKGKPISKVSVDFFNGFPNVLKGKQVE